MHGERALSYRTIHPPNSAEMMFASTERCLDPGAKILAHSMDFLLACSHVLIIHITVLNFQSISAVRKVK